MTDTNVIKLAQPGTFTDLLTEILRDGARALLTQAVETEVADFLGQMLISRPRPATSGSCVTGICPSVCEFFLAHSTAVYNIGGGRFANCSVIEAIPAMPTNFAPIIRVGN